ncbi:M56 family metallopeptidase [Muricauda sp. MAR_2010_75]|jgi:hypothetical protein|uniref:M56 family metallopeptidase n=1 Tax=Allomuricauda sp. MAR_2010_75 TaxID=1250232 RepID=UPI0018CD8F08|nr:M56 family metallopeptidase [Muricauda sp. MAR_2010_75]
MQVNEIGMTQNVSIGTPLAWNELILALGSLSALICFFGKIRKIKNYIKLGKLEFLGDYILVELPTKNTAFSFFNYIFISSDIINNKEIHTSILEHELVHVRQKHTIDLLFFEIMRILFWFNPFSYLYQNRISVLHEYIADNELVSTTNQIEQYKLLLAQALRTHDISLINPFFNNSLVKKRIVMLKRKRSHSFNKLKFLLLIPVIGGMLGFSSSIDLKKESLKLLSDRTLITDGLSTINGIPFALVDRPPIFPSCLGTDNLKLCFGEMLQNHINKRIKSLEIKERESPDKTVKILCTITAEGNVANIKIKGLDKNLENAALDIISSLPKLIPAEHNGEKVNVLFSIPIDFK